VGDGVGSRLEKILCQIHNNHNNKQNKFYFSIPIFHTQSFQPPTRIWTLLMALKVAEEMPQKKVFLADQ
jgi:hypothetical protein